MGATPRVVARSLAWAITPLCLALYVALQVARPGTDTEVVGAGDLPYLVATLASWAVGVVVTAPGRGHRVGRAFLGLGSVLAATALVDAYAGLGTTGGREWPGAELAATVSDTSWIWWFVCLALVLALTAPGHQPGRWSGRLPALTWAAGLCYQVGALFRPTRLGSPYQDLTSPWALPGLLGAVARTAAAVSVLVVGACVLASAVSLAVAWRRADGDARQQMLWLVAGAMPVVPCVVASFAASYAGEGEAVAAVLMTAAIVCLATGAALSALRYRLYDVERVVSDSAGIAAASTAVVAVFLAVLAAISHTTPAGAAAHLPTIVATLAAAAVGRTAYVWAHDVTDKRLNRERFTAVEAVHAGIGGGPTDLDTLLRRALGDPSVRVLYPDSSGGWMTAAGRRAVPSPACVDVHRDGVVTATLEFDPARTDRSVVEAVARAAGAEIDNVALRAELARQVELITESRTRLSTAHLDERRRLERDLHDGAQQRLLAIALQLQAARVNGGTDMLVAEVDRSITELGVTVQELRDLAGGLQPAALAGGGLRAAVLDMADRVPVQLEHDVTDRRFGPVVESAAWFVISEAVTNVVKHACTDRVAVTVESPEGMLRIRVTDQGVGGADPRGRGLQGLADRVAALRGTLTVSANHPHGTLVHAELPCGS